MCLTHEVCAPSFGVFISFTILSFLFLLYFYLLFFRSFFTSLILISDLLPIAGESHQVHSIRKLFASYGGTADHQKMQTHPPDPEMTTSINPPKSLLSLPKELMADICSQLDQKTAINLLYVHRSLHQPAESSIYRDITLSIPTYWGEPVLIRPGRYGTHEYVTWAKKQAKEVELAGRAEARRRAEELIIALSTRGLERWRYIRKMVIEPRVEANNAIIQILSLARNYVTEIEIVKSRDHIYRDQWTPTRKEAFWSKFADFGSVDKYTFPNLVKVIVSLEDWECNCLPELLLQRSPHLGHVELYGGTPTDYSHREPEDPDDYCDCPYQETPVCDATHRSPPWEATLRVAHIQCKAREGHGRPAELAEGIIASGNLEKLTVWVDNLVDEVGDACETVETMLFHPALEHLDYDVPTLTMDEALETLKENTELEYYSSLKTLIYPVLNLQVNHERLEVSLASSICSCTRADFNRNWISRITSCSPILNH